MTEPKPKAAPKEAKTKKAGRPALSAEERAARAKQRKDERAAHRVARKDVPDTARIRLPKGGANPRNEGTVPYRHYQLYTDGMTVGDLLAMPEGNWIHLQADIERGHVTLDK